MKTQQILSALGIIFLCISVAVFSEANKPQRYNPYSHQTGNPLGILLVICVLVAIGCLVGSHYLEEKEQVK